MISVIILAVLAITLLFLLKVETRNERERAEHTSARRARKTAICCQLTAVLALQRAAASDS